MSERRLSVGINISILVILTIFGVLLSLPLRLLFNTNYSAQNESCNENDTAEVLEDLTPPEIIVIPIDHRKLKVCPRFEYVARLKSVFVSDYDGNCTYTRIYETEDVDEDDNEGMNKVTKKDGDEKSKVSKEIVVAGHILVTMLLVSAIAALVEVLRIRFARDKDTSRAGTAGSRKESVVELPVQRRFAPIQPAKSQRSFEMQGMHRSALRLLGARPPPLIRRSSFPTQQAKQNTTVVGGTPNNRLSRRQSAESDEEIGGLMNALHHRTRLIRRH